MSPLSFCVWILRVHIWDSGIESDRCILDHDSATYFHWIRKMPDSVSSGCFVYKIKMIMSGPRWLERLSKLLWQPVDEHRRFPFLFSVTVTIVHNLYFLNNCFFLNFRNQMIQTLHTIIQTENKIWKGKFSLFIHIFYSFSSELMTLKDFFPPVLELEPQYLVCARQALCHWVISLPLGF